VPLSPSNITWY